MRTIHWAVLMGSTVLLTGACKKGSGTGTGGGGAWLVGENGLMENIRPDGTLGAGYELGDGVGDLTGITCRGESIAYVVGDGGTFLRTFDGGETWESVDLGTTSALADVASSLDGVFVAGDGVLKVSYDQGDSWSAMPGDATAAWRAVAADHEGAALLLRLDGSIWRWDPGEGVLAELTTVPGARSLSLSHDGLHAAVVGERGTLSRSDDGGASWTSVATGIDADLHAVWATGDGDIVAVGADGAIVRVDDGGVEATWPGAGTLHAVHVDATGSGIAAGAGGEVLLTADGGETWDIADVELAGTVLGLDSVNGDGHL